MNAATEVKPDTTPGLRTYTLDELVEGARMHGQLLVNASHALWGALEEAERREGTFDDPDLIAFARGRASRASEWLWEIESEGTQTPEGRAPWGELEDTGLLKSLPALVLTAHAAYSDPWGNEHSDVAAMGPQPYVVIVGVARQIGETLLDWAERHGEGADDA